MNTLDLIQGSAEWHEHRATHFNASDAPAMMGLSPYKTRSQLIHELATGITPDIDPATQRRFYDGHRFEALARPVAEKILGEALFPVVGYEGKLSASFDGLTMDETVCFEHKTLNAAYREAIATSSTLPPVLLVQIEQQLMLADATRCLFMASKWEKAPGPDEEPGKVYGFAVDENGDLVRYMLVEEAHCFVESDPELRKALLQGWTQLAIDRDAYVHVDVIPAAVAEPVIGLPAVFVQVDGRVVSGDMHAHRAKVTAWVKKLPSKFDSDQDFADGIAAVKACEKAEDDLSALHQQVLGQMVSVDEVIRLINEAKAEIATARIRIDKAVKAEKENRKAEIVTTAQNALLAHYKALNARIGGNWMPPINALPIAESIKGLKSLDSMRDKVSTALANAKIEANECADRISANRLELVGELDWSFLVPDFGAVCTKAHDDFTAMLVSRIAKHNESEAARIAEAKKAEEARIAAAVEAERKAGEARAAEAAKLTANNQTQFDATKPAGDVIHPVSAVATVQQSDMGLSLDGAAGKSVRTDHIAGAGKEIDEAMIDDFIRLLSISAVEKKALRVNLVKWERYRVARQMQEAA